MFRRRPAPQAPAPPEPAGPALTPSLLDAQGWLLPRSLVGGSPAPVTCVGTVGSPVATAVDPAGLVVGDGWSLDWWVGADDRWHLPAEEAAVRQHRLDETPVVETLLRVPGGDAVHRAYGVRSPRPVGDEWVVAEVENRTPVPFAVSLVIRPFVADGIGDVHEITVEKVPGGKGRDGAHLVRVDGVPAVVLPRGPARVAAGSLAEGDALHTVVDGSAGTGPVTASCPDGLATLALVFPLPHTAVLRAVVPVGEGSEPGALVPYPSVLPDAATVASGWDVHRRTPRFEIPDQRAAEALARARTDVLVTFDGTPDVATLAALDVLDRRTDVAEILARWPERLASPDLAADVALLSTVSHHWLLHRSDPLLEGLLPDVAAAVERIDRAHRRGRLPDGLRPTAGGALGWAAWMLDASGQPDGGSAVRALAEAIGSGARLHGNGAAGAVLEARDGLVRELPDGLVLLRRFPDEWYGGGVEVHDAPTAHGRLSYAVRWHGTRPALLWELVPHDPGRPVQLTAPVLDEDWSTTDPRGESLLAEVAPPEGLDLVTVVAEHPDIDPAMRRPGQAPVQLPDELPDGGSFS